VQYDFEFKPRAIKDLGQLALRDRRRIMERIEAMRDDLAGDVKRLTNFTPEYRLRVGTYRVLFEVVGSTIVVYRVVHRREAYR
jgi:mRNA interferase RelE/StbE